MKIYKNNNYIVVQQDNGNLTQGLCQNVTVSTVDNARFTITGLSEPTTINAILSNIQDQSGTPYDAVSWLAFYSTNTGVQNTSPSATDLQVTRVEISSAQILGMGLQVVTVLPAPLTNEYYSIKGIDVEYNFGTAPYTVDSGIRFYGALNTITEDALITGVENSVYQILQDQTATVMHSIASPLLMTTESGSNPTDGDGTLVFIITYQLRTFGS